MRGVLILVTSKNPQLSSYVSVENALIRSVFSFITAVSACCISCNSVWTAAQELSWLLKIKWRRLSHCASCFIKHVRKILTLQLPSRPHHVLVCNPQGFDKTELIREPSSQLSVSHLKMFMNIWAKNTVSTGCSEMNSNTNSKTTLSYVALVEQFGWVS